ncbi:MAG TPA: hypothetical protein VHO67_03680 [Polyangia bacterium]|nr:hypothetical protein [Polyangia bacterium]
MDNVAVRLIALFASTCLRLLYGHARAAGWDGRRPRPTMPR